MGAAIEASRCLYVIHTQRLSPVKGTTYSNLENSIQVQWALRTQRVRWVERSDTNHLHFVEVMGFAKSSTSSYGFTTRPAQVICPSGGLSTGVSSLISDFPKNISVFTHPKSPLSLLPSRPERGAYHDRHGRWGGMRWTRQR